MATVEQVADIDLGDRLAPPFHPLPPAWEARVFYFILLGRSSHGRENGFRDNGGDPVAAEVGPAYGSRSRMCDDHGYRRPRPPA